ncbi:hypothetical protein WMY93_014070 [Mugilogobius chulae]|uniref:Uncharacterized protein n=1 Tax=Mugilogobius chulae TaxID=88201 RepID=A0AAW0P3F9_9GOBI
MAAASVWTILIGLCIILTVCGKVSKHLPPECRGFFYLEVPPRGLEDPALVFICQYYNRKARFVTLYHTALHSPVYSAYTFKRSAGDVCADVPWMYEPQLFNPGATREMQPLVQVDPGTQPYDQIGLNDYMNAALTIQTTKPPPTLSLTLSRSLGLPGPRVGNPGAGHPHAPQQLLPRSSVRSDGSEQLRENHARRENVRRVVVPAYLWSAYCCPRYDHSAPLSVRYKFPAYAHYGLNADERNEVVEVSLQKLQEYLKSAMSEKSVQIFVNDCAPSSRDMAPNSEP